MTTRAAVQSYYHKFGPNVHGQGFKLNILPAEEIPKPVDFKLRFELDESENPPDWGLEPGLFALDLELEGPRLSTYKGDAKVATSGRFGLRLAKEVHDAEIAKKG